MAVETPEDLAIFFDPRDFGAEAMYAPRTGEPPYSVAGIFDEPSKDFNPNSWPGGHQYQLAEGAHLVSTSPTFWCRSADLVRGGKPRDVLTVGDTAYKVASVQPDGTGKVMLILSDES